MFSTDKLNDKLHINLIFFKKISFFRIEFSFDGTKTSYSSIYSKMYYLNDGNFFSTIKII
jgi:hypothetical protein